MPVDVLAIAAHRDDVELTCAGTLVRASDAGPRTGILDRTAGESGTRGSADLRAREAEQAARILGITERRNAGLPSTGKVSAGTRVSGGIGSGIGNRAGHGAGG